MRRRSDEVRALNELGQAMNTGLELDESLELIASLAADVLRARGAAIRLIVEDGSLALATVLTESEGGTRSRIREENCRVRSCDR